MASERLPENGDEFFVARIIDSAEFSRADLVDMLSGTVAAVLIRRFLPATLCQAAMARLNGGDLRLDAYDRKRVEPPIMRFGPAINDFNDGRRLPPRYWTQAARDRSSWQAAMGQSDPLEASISALADAWGRPVRPASSGGRMLFAGVVREINDGALIHYDDVRREYGADLFDEGTPIVQLTFNTWISVSGEGGTTRVWRRQLRPADARLRCRYGYDAGTVADEARIDLTAGLGDAILFDPRNFHSVGPVRRGRRVAVTFFIGLTGHGELVIWS
jgi:hypothetical protein